MQQQFRYIAAILVITAFFSALSCREISGPYLFRLVVSNPAEISISEGELQKSLNEHFPHREAPDPYLAEITVYGYSSGKEIFSYAGSETDTIEVSQGKGYIESMVRVKKGGETLRMFFVKGEGSTREEMLADMMLRVRGVLNIQ